MCLFFCFFVFRQFICAPVREIVCIGDLHMLVILQGIHLLHIVQSMVIVSSIVLTLNTNNVSTG